MSGTVLDSVAETALRRQVLRQVAHWEGAAERLDDFEASASPAAWNSLERYLGLTLRGELKEAREQLRREAATVRASYNAARTQGALELVSDAVSILRDRYLQTELLVDYYVDAVRSRANPEVGAQLRACDIMAERALSGGLEKLGRPAPPIMTYFKPGIGAAILRMGTKLWDGSLSRVAAIKLTYHNRLRPTALVHETGHQFAALTDWNESLARVLRTQLAPAGNDVADHVAGWSSEIAADMFAFAHTGYGSIAALADVVSGRGSQVFRFIPGDPHPISFVRVLLGIEMCRRFYGMGPWDELDSAWRRLHPLTNVGDYAGGLVTAILPLLPRIVDAGLLTPMSGFAGRRLADLVDPQRVAPASLRQMQRDAGASAFTSSHWVWTECLRLTALSGLRFATEPESGREILKQQEDWMVRLGQLTQQAA